MSYKHTPRKSMRSQKNYPVNEGQNRSPLQRRPGFTLIELLVVIAIIALLVSILMPSLNKAKELAQRSVCQSNLKTMGLGLGMYSGDYDGRFPRPTRCLPSEGILRAYAYYLTLNSGTDAEAARIQLGLLYPNYIDNGEVFHCPSYEGFDNWTNSFDYNGARGWKENYPEPNYYGQGITTHYWYALPAYTFQWQSDRPAAPVDAAEDWGTLTIVAESAASYLGAACHRNGYNGLSAMGAVAWQDDAGEVLIDANLHPDSYEFTDFWVAFFE